ncbi:BTB/POZ protein [Apiospora marii]|uniref:Elongin-C n=1 Tax=Apiospora marii TaxID=335849 RepID=A0ABR1RH19_9PEZI
MAEEEVSKYVTLVSNDGFEFVVLREAVLISPMIKSMVDTKNSFREARLSGRCKFEEISGQVMEKVVEYFHYWYKNREKEDVPDMDIPAELCLELLVAADFLGLDSKKPPPPRGV